MTQFFPFFTSCSMESLWMRARPWTYNSSTINGPNWKAIKSLFALSFVYIFAACSLRRGKILFWIVAILVLLSAVLFRLSKLRIGKWLMRKTERGGNHRCFGYSVYCSTTCISRYTSLEKVADDDMERLQWKHIAHSICGKRHIEASLKFRGLYEKRSNDYWGN